MHVFCFYSVFPWLLATQLNAAYWQALLVPEDVDGNVVRFARRFRVAPVDQPGPMGELIALSSYRRVRL